MCRTIDLALRDEARLSLCLPEQQRENKETALEASSASSSGSPTGDSDPSGVADLRQGGLLAQQLPGYQERAAQIEMAVLVAQALSSKKHAIVEAPTGTGKSLSYLIPIVRSGKTALISTANKALQEQLIQKDIPFVQKHIQWFEAAKVKGFGNYLCLDRLEEVCASPLPAAWVHLVQYLVGLSTDPTSVFTGDLETLTVSLPDDLRTRVNGDRDQCAWSKCPHFQRCYLRQMREQAQQAQVIVVNHTLLSLDAATDGAILPDREVTVVDEAHHLEDEATRAAAVTVKASQITSVLALTAIQAQTPWALRSEIAACLARVWQQFEESLSAAKKDAVTLREPIPEGLRLAELLSQLAETLEQHPPLGQTDKEAVLAQKRIQRVHRLSEQLQRVCAVDQPKEFVYALERVLAAGQQAAMVEISATPLDVSSWLKEHLFDRHPVICASATLATVSTAGKRGPTLTYFKRRVGLDKVEVLERILPLSFDYQRRALLYVPHDVPGPAYDDEVAVQRYVHAIATRMERLVNVSQGRAFLLFSSRRMLDVVYDRIASRLSYPVLRQGDLPRAALVQSFRQQRGSVLFGLRSFWEGIDIAGDALSLVVIDKLPFEPPDNPVQAARVARMIEEGKDWFGEYVLPQAVLQLKQGVGRLLRSQEDRGVMAILDSRLRTRRYGRRVFEALPPAPLTSRLKDVERFFASAS